MMKLNKKYQDTVKTLYVQQTAANYSRRDVVAFDFLGGIFVDPGASVHPPCRFDLNTMISSPPSHHCDETTFNGFKLGTVTVIVSQRCTRQVYEVQDLS